MARRRARIAVRIRRVKLRVKICCIGGHDEAALAVRHGADALGLVSEMPSGPGVITDELARKLAAFFEQVERFG